MALLNPAIAYYNGITGCLSGPLNSYNKVSNVFDYRSFAVAGCSGIFHFFIYFHIVVLVRFICRPASALFQSHSSRISTNTSRESLLSRKGLTAVEKGTLGILISIKSELRVPVRWIIGTVKSYFHLTELIQ